MCIVSDKLKFCSCSTRSVENLPNHWVLHRYVGDQGVYMIGQAIASYNRDETSHALNTETIRLRLSDKDAFDMAIQFKDKDRMELVFTVDKEKMHYLFFCFEFMDGEWTSLEPDPFDLEMHYKKLKKGKIESPEQLLRLDSI